MEDSSDPRWTPAATPGSGLPPPSRPLGAVSRKARPPSPNVSPSSCSDPVTGSVDPECKVGPKGGGRVGGSSPELPYRSDATRHICVGRGRNGARLSLRLGPQSRGWSWKGPQAGPFYRWETRPRRHRLISSRGGWSRGRNVPPGPRTPSLVLAPRDHAGVAFSPRGS